MSKIAVMRTIHALPGKRQQYMEFLRQSNSLRRQFGMSEALVLEKVVDPSVIVVLQVWASEEHYRTWRQSPERATSMREGRQWRVREPSLLYRVLDEDTTGR